MSSILYTTATRWSARYWTTLYYANQVERVNQKTDAYCMQRDNIHKIHLCIQRDTIHKIHLCILENAIVLRGWWQLALEVYLQTQFKYIIYKKNIENTEIGKKIYYFKGEAVWDYSVQYMILYIIYTPYRSLYDSVYYIYTI